MSAAQRRRRLEACRVLWVSDRHRMRCPLVPRAIELLEAGLPGLVLRERDLDDGPFEDMARRLRAVADRQSALLLVTNRLAMAARVAHGVHLGAGGPTPERARHALGEEALIGVSLHRESDLGDAAWQAADYFFLSPVFATESKPAADPMGLEVFATLCRKTSKPVFALGGVTPGRLRACRAAGAHGVAVVGALAHPESAVEAWAEWVF